MGDCEPSDMDDWVTDFNATKRDIFWENSVISKPVGISTFSAWVRTVDMLPGEPGEQADVLMWSPEWATWLKGMVTRWENDACEWAIYNQQDDRYHEWEHVPEFWMSPILPNSESIHPESKP